MNIKSEKLSLEIKKSGECSVSTVDTGLKSPTATSIKDIISNNSLLFPR